MNRTYLVAPPCTYGCSDHFDDVQHSHSFGHFVLGFLSAFRKEFVPYVEASRWAGHPPIV
jgi:hypothetical protein